MGKDFWTLWHNHIPEDVRTENTVQRLEFKLNLYFAVFPMMGEGDQRESPIERSMQDFKTYLENKGADLSQVG